MDSLTCRKDKRRSRSLVVGAKTGYRDKVLSVVRTSKHINAFIIDLETKNILFSVSTQSLKKDIKKTWNIEAAKRVGLEIAKKCVQNNIKLVSFNRGTHQYHGVVAALADSARANGLVF